MTIQELIRQKILILDGAMGTRIQQYGLTEADFRGERFKDAEGQMKGNNDMLNLTRPDVVIDIHRKYLAAGADIIETNTFSSQRISEADYHLESACYDMALAGARLARQAADEFSTEDKPRFVAGSVGPTNKTCSMSPDVSNPALRELTYDQLFDAYCEQMDALMEGGVDAILIETIFDTLNAKAAIDAAQTVMRQRELERDSTARERFAKDSIFIAKRTEKQSYDNRLFEYTDNSVDRLPLLYENFFGEGFILHPEHLMEDANLKKNPRPVLVYYNDWWNYVAEGAILVLFLAGILYGWRKRLLWLAMMPFLFDVLLHIGMRFAATDVYIMTAHWAYVVPIAIGIMLKGVGRSWRRALGATLILLTLFLWWHNLSLLVPYLLP